MISKAFVARNHLLDVAMRFALKSKLIITKNLNSNQRTDIFLTLAFYMQWRLLHLHCISRNSWWNTV